jgi:thiopeptide-type bacteriocin biosynthesis protein
MHHSAVRPDHGWLYFKLYPGAHVDRADALVAAAALRVQAIDPTLPWFYLRYFDATGFHLRLRVRPAAEARATVGARLRAELDELLAGLDTLPANLHQPMVLPRGATGDPLAAFARGAPPRVEQDRYEPEYDKYGGARGTPLAETLFAASSRIALAVLDDERAGLYTRKAVAPWLMQLCFDAYTPSLPGTYFRQYSRFWLGGDAPAAEDWRERFFHKARALSAQGIVLLPPERELHPTAACRLAQWREALAETVAAYAAAGRRAAAGRDVLAFNFSHLMNNRLGFSALEEAYLATLLEHLHRRSERAAPPGRSPASSAARGAESTPGPGFVDSGAEAAA